MDHKDLCNHTRIKLIASAIGHQQCTKTASNIIPLPGTDRVIAIGTPAEVRGLLGAAPLTAPAPLTDELAAEVKRLHDALCFWLPQNRAGLPDAMSERIAADAYLLVGYDDMPDKQSAEELGWIAAPAPQQSALSDNQIMDIAEPFHDINGVKFDEVAFARELLGRAKAAPAAPVQTAEPKRIPDMLTVETIQGAIAFGRMGINPPPSPDHWGNEFWQIGRQLAKLGETSAWDNVTPVDVAAPVQADQAQAEQAAAVRAAALEEAALAAEKVADDFCERQGGKWPDLRDDAETGARSCVDEIRALAAPSTATSNDTGALGDAGGAK